nr:hypothetical protein [Pandoravirus massiliensis]
MTNTQARKQTRFRTGKTIGFAVLFSFSSLFLSPGLLHVPWFGLDARADSASFFVGCPVVFAALQSDGRPVRPGANTRAAGQGFYAVVRMCFGVCLVPHKLRDACAGVLDVLGFACVASVTFLAMCNLRYLAHVADCVNVPVTTATVALNDYSGLCRLCIGGTKGNTRR